MLTVFALKNPGRGFVFALKNPGRGVFVALFSLKNPGRGFCVERVRSQKPLVGRVLTVLALKNCSCSLSKTRVVLIVLALKNPGGGFGI